MNTEEILLQILEEQKKTRADINDIRTDISEMRTDINGIHLEINEMRSEMNEMRSDITELQNNQREMLDRQDKFDERMAGFESRQDNFDKKLDNVEAKQDTLEKDVKSIKITLENEVSPAIRTLTEMQVQNSGRLVVIENDVRDLKDNFAINEVLFGLEKMKSHG